MIRAVFAAPCAWLPNGFVGCSSSHAAFTMVVLFFLLVRRSVRSTSAASRRDAERARYKVQVPNIALKAFLDLKSLALKAYLKVRLEIQT